MLVEKIYILGALLKLPFFTHDEEMKNWANSYLTFHSWSLFLFIHSPEIFLKLATSFNVKPEQILVFEDSLVALRTAKSA